MKKLSLLSTLVLFISMTTIATAQPQRGQRGPEAGNRMDQPGKRMMMIPDLTQEQKTAMKDIATQTRKEMLPLRNQVNELRAQLQTLRTQDNSDMGKIEQKIEEIGELRTEMAIKRATSHQKIREMLTDDQKVWFDTHMANRGQKGQGMRGRGMNRGQGMK